MKAAWSAWPRRLGELASARGSRTPLSPASRADLRHGERARSGLGDGRGRTHSGGRNRLERGRCRARRRKRGVRSRARGRRDPCGPAISLGSDLGDDGSRRKAFRSCATTSSCFSQATTGPNSTTCSEFAPAGVGLTSLRLHAQDPRTRRPSPTESHDEERLFCPRQRSNCAQRTALLTDAEIISCEQTSFRMLERSGLENHEEAEARFGEPRRRISPPSTRRPEGLLYGRATHGWRASFRRGRDPRPGFRGLYLAGGSVHPGPGAPMAALRRAAKRPCNVIRCGPCFDQDVVPGGYAWWYLDAISDDGQHGLTVIAFIGSVFSPYYAWAGRRDPLDHCAFNVALYGPRASLWSMTERRRSAVMRSRDSLAIGRTTASWEHGALVLDIRERAAPIPRRIRGRITIHPQAINPLPFVLEERGQHWWRPLAPRARVTVKMSAPALRWQGSGYVDQNAGAEPIEQAFSQWTWSRAATRDGTAIIYDAVRRREPPLSLALAFDRHARFDERASPPSARLPRTRWRVLPGRRARNEGRATSAVRSFEDTPVLFSRGPCRAHTPDLGEPVESRCMQSLLARSLLSTLSCASCFRSECREPLATNFEFRARTVFARFSKPIQGTQGNRDCFPGCTHSQSAAGSAGLQDAPTESALGPPLLPPTSQSSVSRPGHPTAPVRVRDAPCLPSRPTGVARSRREARLQRRTASRRRHNISHPPEIRPRSVPNVGAVRGRRAHGMKGFAPTHDRVRGSSRNDVSASRGFNEKVCASKLRRRPDSFQTARTDPRIARAYQKKFSGSRWNTRARRVKGVREGVAFDFAADLLIDQRRGKNRRTTIRRQKRNPGAGAGVERVRLLEQPRDDRAKPFVEVGFGEPCLRVDSRFPQPLSGQIDPTETRILADIARNVGELHRDPKVAGAGERLRRPHVHDERHHHADGACDARSIVEEFADRLVASAL